MKEKQNKKGEKGIVLLEAIIAIGVLATIFTATLSLSMTSTKGVRMANNQVIATFLAQDAMERVVAKRQYNHEHKDVVTWLDGLIQCTPSNPCTGDFDLGNDGVDDTADPFVNCVGSCALYIDANGKYSNDSSGTLTPYSRSVEVDILNSSLGTDFEAEVTVRVSWKDKNVTHEFPLTFILYDEPN